VSAVEDTRWESRIIGTGTAEPATLHANPHNFRRHPDAWLAGHLLDKYADVRGEDTVSLA
jgi:hypothetical protein